MQGVALLKHQAFRLLQKLADHPIRKELCPPKSPKFRLPSAIRSSVSNTRSTTRFAAAIPQSCTAVSAVYRYLRRVLNPTIRRGESAVDLMKVAFRTAKELGLNALSGNERRPNFSETD